MESNRQFRWISVAVVSLVLATVVVYVVAKLPDGREETPKNEAAAQAGVPATLPPLTKARIEEGVLVIRAEYQRINALKVKKEEFPIGCPDERMDATISYWRENGRIVKIVVDWGVVGDGYSFEEYYYMNGRYIFGFTQAGSGVGNLPGRIDETRTYVQDDRVIRYKYNQDIGECSRCNFDRSSLEYRLLDAHSRRNFRELLCD